MRQITLSDENYEILQACIEFCVEDLQETEGALHRSDPSKPSVPISKVLDVQAAVEIFVKTVDNSE